VKYLTVVKTQDSTQFGAIEKALAELKEQAQELVERVERIRHVLEARPFTKEPTS
jgi:hypothetical protein